jgi:uncharacterized RDD family membrane protein YckC
MANRHLIPDPFHVDPSLLGQPIASPLRRFVAFAIDAIIVILPTLVVATGAAALSFYLVDRPGFEAVRHVSRLADKDSAVASAEARALAPVLVKLEAAGVPPAVAVAVEDGDLDRAAELLRDANIVFGLELIGESGETKLPPKTIRFPVEKLIPAPIRAIALLGVPALYFAGFSRSRRGATPGKRLLRIRVVRLNGERMSWLEGLERFVGYIHIPATAFVSLLDLWRDPNRRLPHDRTVHTAVLRVERTTSQPHAPQS